MKEVGAKLDFKPSAMAMASSIGADPDGVAAGRYDDVRRSSTRTVCRSTKGSATVAFLRSVMPIGCPVDGGGLSSSALRPVPNWRSPASPRPHVCTLLVERPGRVRRSRCGVRVGRVTADALRAAMRLTA